MAAQNNLVYPGGVAFAGNTLAMQPAFSPAVANPGAIIPANATVCEFGQEPKRKPTGLTRSPFPTTSPTPKYAPPPPPLLTPPPSHSLTRTLFPFPFRQADGEFNTEKAPPRPPVSPPPPYFPPTQQEMRFKCYVAMPIKCLLPDAQTDFQPTPVGEALGAVQGGTVPPGSPSAQHEARAKGSRLGAGGEAPH